MRSRGDPTPKPSPLFSSSLGDSSPPDPTFSPEWPFCSWLSPCFRQYQPLCFSWEQSLRQGLVPDDSVSLLCAILFKLTVDIIHVCDSVSIFLMRHNYAFLLQGVHIPLRVVSGSHVPSFTVRSLSYSLFIASARFSHSVRMCWESAGG